MSYQNRGKQEGQLVEWSGFFGCLILMGIIAGAVYLFAVPFMRVIAQQVDFLSLIGGF